MIAVQTAHQLAFFPGLEIVEDDDGGLIVPVPVGEIAAVGREGRIECTARSLSIDLDFAGLEIVRFDP